MSKNLNLKTLLKGIRNRLLDLIYRPTKLVEENTRVLKAELLEQQQQIKQLNEEITVNISNRIRTTEENLNYYSMIRSIMDENKYLDNELAFIQLQKSNSAKILVCGFFGADNLGDELMLQTLLSSFPKELLPSVTVMLFDNDDYDYYHLPGVNFIHCPTKKFDYNILANTFDVLIWGGGALIDDTDYSDASLTLNNMFINLSLRFLAFNKKVVALGLSTNKDLTNTSFLENLRFICENSAYFSIRDKNSQKLLNNKGITNTVLGSDLVFYNKLWENKPALKVPSETVTIGIIWICYEDTEELFLKIIDKLRNKFGNNCKIKCIPFYNYVSLDKRYFSKMIERIDNSDNITILDYSNNLEKVVLEIADTDYMVNMRYHGMMLSSLLNKKSLNICYDTHRHYVNKINYLTELFKTQKSSISFTELRESPQKLELVFCEPKSDVKSLIKPNKDLQNILLSALK